MTAARTRTSRGARALATVLVIAAAPACSPDAHLGYWKMEVGAQAGTAGDAPGASGGSGALGGQDGAGMEAMPMLDAAVEMPVAGSAAQDAQVAMPIADGGGPPSADSGICDLGGGVTLPDEITIDAGETVDFASARELPAGRYRVSYVDGCRKFNEFTNSGWTVHGIPNTLTRATEYSIIHGDLFVATAPGTYGLMIGPGQGFETYAECVAANLLLPPVEFDFEGGTLAIVDISDTNPADDVSGETEGGRNPTFELARLDPCP